MKDSSSPSPYFIPPLHLFLHNFKINLLSGQARDYKDSKQCEKFSPSSSFFLTSQVILMPQETSGFIPSPLMKCSRYNLSLVISEIQTDYTLSLHRCKGKCTHFVFTSRSFLHEQVKEQGVQNMVLPVRV